MKWFNIFKPRFFHGIFVFSNAGALTALLVITVSGVSIQSSPVQLFGQKPHNTI